MAGVRCSAGVECCGVAVAGVALIVDVTSKLFG